MTQAAALRQSGFQTVPQCSNIPSILHSSSENPQGAISCR
ncbi:hypothetical protein HMPREF9418_2546 [Neisseria macacae ATCC 33926]|uniref:Uncharacterized protein n=1 Tax=Neisseria macacae ATCC 33926 TaxID=997348 RepID=A0AA36UI58_9NEIS|nr:hypothetical protein HMPREF9418_2546 [Neisseria macacae ATCC 33926]